MTKAEDFIQKQKYADAELLLQKIVTSDASNYVAWFDLGFVENGLGKRDESMLHTASPWPRSRTSLSRT